MPKVQACGVNKKLGADSSAPSFFLPTHSYIGKVKILFLLLKLLFLCVIMKIITWVSVEIFDFFDFDGGERRAGIFF